MLERIVKSVPGTWPVVWGIDQEFIMSPTYLFERLARLAPTWVARDHRMGRGCRIGSATQ